VSVEAFDRSAPQFWVSVESESGTAERVLVVDGRGAGDPSPGGAARLLSFEYTDSERQADKLKLTVDNFNLEHFDDPIWKKGTAITARWGYPGRMAPERRLIITKVTGALALDIEARAESVLLNRVTRCRVFDGMRRSDVVRRIAREAGYGDDAQDVEDTQVVLAHITQARQTDAQFLMRMAREEGFEFYVDFDGFHFHSRRTGQRPVRRFRWYTDPVMGEMISFNVENDITARPGRVRVVARDAEEGEDVDATADTSASDSVGRAREALAEIIEIIDPETRASRVEERVAQEETQPTASPDAAEAARVAAGRQRRHQQVAVKLAFDAIGDPLMLAKTVIQMEGLGRRLSVRYYVKEVVHKVGGGYTMSIKCVSDGHGGHSTTSRAAPGVELLDPGPAQRARLNTGEAPEGATGEHADGDGPPPLTQRDVVDPESRRTRTAYFDEQGREVRSRVRSDVITPLEGL